MKRTAVKCIGLAVIAGAAFALVQATGAGSSAHASDRRIAGGECRDWYSNTLTHRTGRFRNPNSGTLGVYCGVPSDNLLRHDQITQVNMHGYNTGGMATRACVQYYNGSGATCGTAIGWDPGNGYKSITGGYLSAWAGNPYHFPYLHTDTPAYSMIYGMWMHN